MTQSTFIEQLLHVPHLDSVPGLGCDPLHGQDDLEGVLPDVAGAHAVQGRLLVNLVAHHDGPEHLEKVLRAVHLNTKVHGDQVVGNFLQH